MTSVVQSRGRKRSGKIFAGRYAYVKPLGRGAGGSVYLAEDLRHDRRPVALKVLSAEAYQTIQGKMIRREFEILSKLDHVNLVHVYDYGTMPDGGVFLAEEFIDGFSLQDARALLPPAQLIDITVQILEGLSYLHGMGMIHRDIKPANVMLLWLDDVAARPMVKLVDFGLSSKDPKRDTLRGGTRSYMAPEIITGQRGELRSDLFSLGVTLYYTLCGVLPYGPRSKDDPPTSEETFRPPEPHRLNPEVPLVLSRFTMVLLRLVDGVEYVDAGEALQALAADSESFGGRASGGVTNPQDVAAAPVLRGYFERGILARRVEECEKIVEWLGDAEIHRPGEMQLIVAREGVGRSRLLQDVESAVKLIGYQVVRTACRSGMTPLALMYELLGQILGIASGRQLELAERLRGELAIRKQMAQVGIGMTEGRAGLSDVRWLGQCFEDVLAGLEPSRVVMFVDDIELADMASIDWLANWYQALPTTRRPEVVATAAVGKVTERLLVGGAIREMRIEGVRPEDVGVFFSHQLGLADLPEAWFGQVARQSDGRPAYMEELCRHLIDAQVLRRQSARGWSMDLDELTNFAVPASLRESFRRRMSAAGAGARELLEFLSLFKRPLLLEQGRRLLMEGGMDEDSAERVLQNLLWRNLISVDVSNRGRFIALVHPGLGDAVRDMLSPEWERALHRRMGLLLVDAWREGTARAREVAEHLMAGGRADTARDMYQVAGDAEAAEGLFQDADKAYTLARSGRPDGPAAVMLELGLASTALARYDATACRNYLRYASELAESIGHDWILHRVYVSAARLSMALGESDVAFGWRDRMRNRLPAFGTVAEVRLMDADLYLWQGELIRASNSLEAAIEQSRNGGDVRVLVKSLTAYGNVQILQGFEVGGLRAYDEAMEISTVLDNPADGAGRVLAAYGADFRRLGRLDEAAAHLEEATNLLAHGSRPDLWVRCHLATAWCDYDQEQFERARRRAQEGLVLATKLGHRSLVPLLSMFLHILDLGGNGDPAAAVARIQLGVSELRQSPAGVLDRSEILIATAHALFAAGQDDVANTLINEGRRLAEQAGAHQLLSFSQS